MRNKTTFTPFLVVLSDAERVNELSKERVVNALKGYGLSDIDAQVYVFLARNGSNDVNNLASALNMHRGRAQGSVKRLQDLNIVKASVQYPLEFVAVPFEEVLGLLIRSKKEQAKAIQESREELLSSWQRMVKKDSKNS